ncbi:MAG TPA: methyltransferase domain-containing protein [Aggregicoccus sp.]|nr:methyltransferase domain-containing protein [Aggregicoccus sp.]
MGDAAEQEQEEARVRALYGELAPLYDALYPTLHRYGPRAARFLEAAVRPGARVLDLGCGSGQLTRDLPADVQVVGLDLAEPMLALARAGRPAGLYRAHSFLQPVPAELGRFDVALALGCLDFCADLPRALSHLAAALRPGARALVSVLERRAGLPGHEEARRVLRALEPPVTLYFWSFAHCAQALEAAGLQPLGYAHAPAFDSEVEGLTLHYGFWELQRACSPAVPASEQG